MTKCTQMLILIATNLLHQNLKKLSAFFLYYVMMKASV